MKTFSETWTNPKTKEFEQIEVHEYFLEDWEDGALVDSVGKHLVHDLNDNIIITPYPQLRLLKLIPDVKKYILQKLKKSF